MRVLTLLLLIPILTGCAALDLLGGLSGGGPQANVNAQLGQENNQSFISNRSTEGIIRPRVRGDLNNTTRIDTVNETPAWLVGALVLSLFWGFLGWIAPTPKTMWLNFWSQLRRKRK